MSGISFKNKMQNIEFDDELDDPLNPRFFFLFTETPQKIYHFSSRERMCPRGERKFGFCEFYLVEVWWKIEINDHAKKIGWVCVGSNVKRLWVAVSVKQICLKCQNFRITARQLSSRNSFRVWPVATLQIPNSVCYLWVTISDNSCKFQLCTLNSSRSILFCVNCDHRSTLWRLDA